MSDRTESFSAGDRGQEAPLDGGFEIERLAIDFEFNDSMFLGTPVIDRPADGPLRGTLIAIGNAVPEMAYLTDVQARKNHIKRVDNWLSQTVTVNRTKLQRKELLDQTKAADELILKLAYEKSPVVEALIQVGERYGVNSDKSKTGNETLDKRRLTDDQLTRLAVRVLWYTHPSELDALLRRQLSGEIKPS